RRPDSECSVASSTTYWRRIPMAGCGSRRGVLHRVWRSRPGDCASASRGRNPARRARYPRQSRRGLLLNRDFTGARQEYAAARALRAVHADVARIPAFGTAADIAWSYFLEGPHTEVGSTARRDRVSGPLASADPSLLA